MNGINPDYDVMIYFDFGRIYYEDKKFNLKFEKKIPVLNGCKYKFVPTIKITKNKLEKAINNSLLKKYLREVYLIGVSFIE